VVVGELIQDMPQAVSLEVARECIAVKASCIGHAIGGDAAR
jgi:hypothetical protein